MTGIYLDFETGGLDTARCGITQIGAVAFDMSAGGTIIVDTFTSLICPSPDLFYSPAALRIQGRTLQDPDLLGAPPEDRVLESFLAWAHVRRGDGIWSHHAPFDEGCLTAMMLRGKLDPPSRGSIRCTKQLFRILVSAGRLPAIHDNRSGQSSLRALVRRFGIAEHSGAHDAMQDARMGTSVLWHLLQASGWLA